MWVTYVVSVGGDFMEYRFFIPVLPLAFLATYWVMCELDSRTARAEFLSGAHPRFERGRCACFRTYVATKFAAEF